LGSVPFVAGPQAQAAAPVRKALPFRMGCAGYTFVKYDLETALQMMKRLDIRYMSLKDFHLPINSDDAKIADVLALFKKYDVTPYAVGPIYMNTEAEVKNAFAYAKRVGVDMIVGIPKYELLPLVDELVKEYNFKVAIHIHGPDTPLFPDATDVWKHVEKLDSRIGICYDIAHTVRTGANLLKDYKKYSSRIYDMHIRFPPVLRRNRQKQLHRRLQRGVRERYDRCPARPCGNHRLFQRHFEVPLIFSPVRG
jgi:hypothetical protein